MLSFGLSQVEQKQDLGLKCQTPLRLCHLILVLLFKPMGQISDLQLTSFWYILVGVVVLVLVLDVLVTGVKQSQLLDISLGLGLEFDNN